MKIPFVPGEDSNGVVLLERYFVAEGDIIEKDEKIALARTNYTPFDIVSNYRGRILKIILSPNTLVGFRDAIATMELLQDPMDGVLIEYCKLRDDS